MDLGQALLLVLSFPALAILLAAVTLIEERVLGGPALSLPGNQPETGDMHLTPSPYDLTRPIPPAHLPQHDHVLPAVTHDGGAETTGVPGRNRAGLTGWRRAGPRGAVRGAPSSPGPGEPVGAQQQTKAQ